MLCIICREREAEVPDRERLGRPIKRVCKKCHADRLRSDLTNILELHNKKKKKEHTPDDL